MRQISMTDINKIPTIIDNSLLKINQLIVHGKLPPCADFSFWWSYLDKIGYNMIKSIKSFDLSKITAKQYGELDYELFIINEYQEQGELTDNQYLDWFIDGLADFIEEVYNILKEVNND
jgi:hypothetical protein